LSFLLHIPASEIDNWPLNELNRYHNYYRRFGFPQWRIEQAIALNTLMTARAAGDDSLQLEDLLLPYKADDEFFQDETGEQDDLEEMEALLDSI